MEQLATLPPQGRDRLVRRFEAPLDTSMLVMDPWSVGLIVVRNGSHGTTERRALARDIERGALVRVRQGVYVGADVWAIFTGGQRHVVAMRALGAVSAIAPVFSHWSAALVHDLPFMHRGLSQVHVTVPDRALRGLAGVTGHVVPVREQEVVAIGGLLVTDMSRTVVDIAGASRFDDALVVADGALAAGLPRRLLEQAVDLAGPRRSAVRIAAVADFAHPGGESANESKSRSTMFRLGVEPPELQFEVWDEKGLAGVVDTWWSRRRVIGEADGASKYLDPKLAKDGAGRAVYAEKQREDRVRARAEGLARWGWAESCSTTLLGPVLGRIGIHPLLHRPTLDDWAALARDARPRRPRARLVPIRGTDAVAGAGA